MRYFNHFVRRSNILGAQITYIDTRIVKVPIKSTFLYKISRTIVEQIYEQCQSD